MDIQKFWSPALVVFLVPFVVATDTDPNNNTCFSPDRASGIWTWSSLAPPTDVIDYYQLYTDQPSGYTESVTHMRVRAEMYPASSSAVYGIRVGSYDGPSGAECRPLLSRAAPGVLTGQLQQSGPMWVAVYHASGTGAYNHRAIVTEDDAGSGGDADDASCGTTIDSGTWTGSLLRLDSADCYRILPLVTGVGRTIQVTMRPDWCDASKDSYQDFNLDLELMGSLGPVASRSADCGVETLSCTPVASLPVRVRVVHGSPGPDSVANAAGGYTLEVMRGAPPSATVCGV